MRLHQFLAALALLALCLAPLSAADLTKIDRTIGKEPVYQTKTPTYCLLLFGPEAKTRVWLVRDGDKFYVDRNCNGDLTDDPATGDIIEPDKKTRHTSVSVRPRGNGNVRVTMMVEGKRRYYVGWDPSDLLFFASRPDDAPIVHLGGPLTSRMYEAMPQFRPGVTSEVNISVGTPGVGKGSFAAINCCTILDCGVAPIADIEFPPRTPGEKPIPVRVKIAED